MNGLTDKERRLLMLLAEVLRTNPYTSGEEKKEILYQIKLVTKEWEGLEGSLPKD